MKKLPVFLRNRGLRGWLREERGSFTLESVFVFPVLLALICSFIVFGLYFYQNVIVYYAASAVAESAAFNWDNSHRDVRTGMLKEPLYDGLYWRMSSDGALGSMLGTLRREEAEAVRLPDDAGKAQDGEGTLSRRKLLLSAGWLQSAELSYEGDMRLGNMGVSRYVEVRLKKPLNLFPWETGWIRGEPAAAASSYIADSVEFIRTVDLLRYYAGRLTASSGGKEDEQARAAKVLASYEVQRQ